MPRTVPRILIAGFALLLAPAAQATLAVAVPSRDGLVIAADSRMTFMGAQCDGAFKILIPARPARTVAVVTGDGIFVAPPPRGADPCRYLAGAPRLLDMDAVVTRALEHAGGDADRIDAAALAAACVRAVERFRAAHPGALRGYAGRAIFSVLVASFDRAGGTSTMRNFVVRVNGQTGRVEASRLRTAVIEPDQPGGVWIYGETDWVNRHVYAGVGRGFLTPATQKFLRVQEPVSATPLDRAAAVAANVMEAACRAAQMEPPPSGIGGEIHLVVAGRSRRPEPLPFSGQP
jgi:hypothetical protein